MAKICKVLVVEDNEHIRQLLADVLDQEGYHFTVVANGEEMRRALAGGDVDVVILDMVLRGSENGLSLAREAAELGVGVILTTGSITHRDALEQCGHRYLFKPFRLSALLQLIDEVLKTTKARCEVKDRAYG